MLVLSGLNCSPTCWSFSYWMLIGCACPSTLDQRSLMRVTRWPWSATIVRSSFTPASANLVQLDGVGLNVAGVGMHFTIRSVSVIVRSPVVGLRVSVYLKPGNGCLFSKPVKYLDGGGPL